MKPLLHQKDCLYFLDPHDILRFPRKIGYTVPDRLRKKIAVHLVMVFQKPLHEMLPLVPHSMEMWGKLRIKDGGDCIRTAGVRVNKTSRDQSFIKVHCTYFITPTTTGYS